MSKIKLPLTDKGEIDCEFMMEWLEDIVRVYDAADIIGTITAHEREQCAKFIEKRAEDTHAGTHVKDVLRTAARDLRDRR